MLMKQLRAPLLTLALALVMVLQLAAPAFAEDGVLVVEDGMMQPILRYSDPRAADYTNAESEILRYCVYVETDHDTDMLSAYNCGGTFLDNDWTVPNEDYGSWLWQISRDQDATNGDYAPIWASSDYSGDYEKINCSALVVQGLNDFNVTTKQADLMMQAFAKAGMPAKLVLHQDGHNTLDGKMVNGELWQELMNKWLSHWLYGVDNGIENMPAVTVQSNLDGSYASYDAWRGFASREMPSLAATLTTAVNTEGLAAYATGF